MVSMLLVVEYIMCGCTEILAPSGYRALSGDLRLKVTLGAEMEAEACVQVLERPAGGVGWAVVSAAPVRRGEAVFPCGIVSRGGHYGLRLASTHQECQEPEASSYGSTTVRDNEVITTTHDLSTTTSHYVSTLLPIYSTYVISYTLTESISSRILQIFVNIISGHAKPLQNPAVGPSL